MYKLNGGWFGQMFEWCMFHPILSWFGLDDDFLINLHISFYVDSSQCLTEQECLMRLCLKNEYPGIWHCFFHLHFLTDHVMNLFGFFCFVLLFN